MTALILNPTTFHCLDEIWIQHIFLQLSFSWMRIKAFDLIQENYLIHFEIIFQLSYRMYLESTFFFFRLSSQYDFIGFCAIWDKKSWMNENFIRNRVWVTEIQGYEFVSIIITIKSKLLIVHIFLYLTLHTYVDIKNATSIWIWKAFLISIRYFCIKYPCVLKKLRDNSHIVQILFTSHNYQYLT